MLTPGCEPLGSPGLLALFKEVLDCFPSWLSVATQGTEVGRLKGERRAEGPLWHIKLGKRVVPCLESLGLIKILYVKDKEDDCYSKVSRGFRAGLGRCTGWYKGLRFLSCRSGGSSLPSPVLPISDDGEGWALPCSLPSATFFTKPLPH